MDWFKFHEAAEVGSQFNWTEVMAEIKFNQDGLIPCIAQQKDTKEVLMMAWMNREAITRTLAEGTIYYWSRSRQKLWKKGEQSGQLQHLIELRVDCDGDTLLAIVNQKGVACHTGRTSCFFYSLQENHSTDSSEDGLENSLVVNTAPVIDPAILYKKT